MVWQGEVCEHFPYALQERQRRGREHLMEKTRGFCQQLPMQTQLRIAILAHSLAYFLPLLLKHRILQRLGKLPDLGRIVFLRKFFSDLFPTFGLR